MIDYFVIVAASFYLAYALCFDFPGRRNSSPVEISSRSPVGLAQILPRIAASELGSFINHFTVPDLTGAVSSKIGRAQSF